MFGGSTETVSPSVVIFLHCIDLCGITHVITADQHDLIQEGRLRLGNYFGGHGRDGLFHKLVCSFSDMAKDEYGVDICTTYVKGASGERICDNQQCIEVNNV